MTELKLNLKPEGIKINPDDLFHRKLLDIDKTNKIEGIKAIFQKNKVPTGQSETEAGDSVISDKLLEDLADSQMGEAITGYEAMAEAEELKKEEKLDSFTGLKNKGQFFKDLHKRLLEPHLDDESFFVFSIDLGLLSLVNGESGHLEGDEYIKKFASVWKLNEMSDMKQTSQLSFYDAYHEGGDEFMLLIRGTKDNVQQFLAKRVEMIKNIQDQGELTLSVALPKSGEERKLPHDLLMDISQVEVTQSVIDNYKRFIGDKDEINTKDLGELVTLIAEYRRDIAKAKKRLIFLVGLYHDDRPLFDRVYPYAAKGALGIPENDIKAFGVESEGWYKFYVKRTMTERIVNEADRKRLENPLTSLFLSDIAQNYDHYFEY